ncbi:L-serine ammonia-lyase, iron-sulfur-dependent, subunit alpha [Clostridium sp.]
MLYHSVSDLIRLSNEHQIPLWKVVLLADVQERQVTEEESFETMRQMYQAMRQADQEYDGSIVSASGMAGGDGEKLHAYNASGRSLAGGYMGLVMEKAVKMGESNACMKRIVAAPTAGACGVIPAVFLSYEEYCKEEEERMVEALFVSAGIGAVIAENASIAGASGGCQAEIGSASAMAAGGLAYLQGGDAECIANATAFALKNMLGLTCDPVCGLVEVPCIKRNSAGAVNAAASAQMAMAGIKSAIPVDEVIDSMRRIGNALPSSLRETSEGGLAVTESARKIAEQMGKKEHISEERRGSSENRKNKTARDCAACQSCQGC